MSIAKKLFASIAILAMVCLGLAACGLWALSNTSDITSQRRVVQKQLYDISEIRSLSRALQRDAYQLASAADEMDRRELSGQMGERLHEMKAAVDALEATLDAADRERLGGAYVGKQAAVIGQLEQIRQRWSNADAGQLAERIRTDLRPAEQDASNATNAFLAAKQATYEQLAAEAEDIITRARWVILIAGLLGVGVAVPLALTVASRGINRPLQQLAATMERLAAGDTSHEVPLVERGDEIGAMARTVATFRSAAIERDALQEKQAAAAAEQQRLLEEQAALQAQNLAECERQLEEARRQEQRANRIQALIDSFRQEMARSLATVTEASQHLLATADQMNGAVLDTNERTKAVDAASGEASANVQMVAAATEEMTASIDEISRQCVNAKALVDQVAAGASDTTQKMQSMVRVSSQVAEIVGIISDIAEQTNLLALNATIEAARAGDSGRGFAVVAGEVKGLASQVARATEDITSKVGAMQAEAATSADALDRMGESVSKLTEIAAVIAAGMEEQNATVQEIARNVQHAAGGVGEVASNIRGVATTTGETAQAARSVRSASEALSREAETLRESIGAFLEQVQAA
ncbi:methyl-accepting chemotaxis protein [Pedomonas sp. V897]|uniref:methyl-accepting chemotaxis protein n=1 Tax=Pedomonas sp. V897 TaxID=3446482 RepID=UPI003EDF0569